MSSGKWRPFCLGLNVLKHHSYSLCSTISGNVHTHVIVSVCLLEKQYARLQHWEMNDWSTICIRLLGKQQLTRSDILRGPLLLTLISESSMEFKEWISNHVQIKIWHVITHPCLYVRDGWVIATHYKIWGVITYPCPMRTHYAQKYNQENGTAKDPTYPHPTHPIHTHIPTIYSPAHYNW